jgi:hypothetical protein
MGQADEIFLRSTEGKTKRELKIIAFESKLASNNKMVWTLPQRRKNSKGFEHGNNRKTQRSGLKWKQS